MLPAAPRLGEAQYARSALQPGDSAVSYVPTAWTTDASGHVVGRGFRHVRLRVLHADEVQSFHDTPVRLPREV
jgi:hypothetical protein